MIYGKITKPAELRMWKMTIGNELRKKFERCFISSPSCWLWISGTDSHGYGKIQYQCSSHKAHRLAYQIYVGNIPDGLHVLHRCDNPRCVNPDHLFIGSHADNMKDKTTKGRAHGAHPGSDHHKAKLTDCDVLKIRSDPRCNRLISEEYGICRQQVGDIKHRKYWSHI